MEYAWSTIARMDRATGCGLGCIHAQCEGQCEGRADGTAAPVLERLSVLVESAILSAIGSCRTAAAYGTVSASASAAKAAKGCLLNAPPHGPMDGSAIKEFK